MKKQSILECKRVRFYSQPDEDAFFEYLKKMPCVGEIKGKGDKILVFIKGKVSNEDMRNFVALFRRYKISTKKLEEFLTSKNKHLFEHWKTGFHCNVYPAGD